MLRDVAIIGGGRWGRVILSVLAASDLPFGRITLVTTHNAPLARDLVSRLVSRHPIEIASALSDAPSAAIIVNSARSHSQTAHELITRGVHLLIEKPVTLRLQETEQIIAQARAARTILLPGLSYRFCSYIHNFAERITPLRPLSSFELRWSDPASEIRYGEKKTYDESINVADDVMPHICSILSVLFPDAIFTVTSCRAVGGGKSATFALRERNLEGVVTLERDSDRRRRIVRLTSQASLDFTEEPGIMTIGTETATADPDWKTSPRPLARQLRYFLECVERGETADADGIALTESVRMAESASALLAACVAVPS